MSCCVHFIRKFFSHRFWIDSKSCLKHLTKIVQTPQVWNEWNANDRGTFSGRFFGNEYFISQPYSFSVMVDVFFSVYSFRICFSMQYWHSEQHGIFLILVVFRLARKEPTSCEKQLKIMKNLYYKKLKINIKKLLRRLNKHHQIQNKWPKKMDYGNCISWIA